ncbi:hypothetical protein V1504DRAFT_436897 [Lipomyces starkeyi]
MSDRTSRSPAPGAHSSEDGSLVPSPSSTTPRTYISLPPAMVGKSVLHGPRTRRSLGVFDILKRSHSDLIERDTLGKLHSTSFQRIKEVAGSMSEEEKDALNKSAVDLAVAVSRLYASMSAEIAKAEEIDSEEFIEALFVLKRGNNLYYHGTTAARRLLDLQHE